MNRKINLLPRFVKYAGGVPQAMPAMHYVYVPNVDEVYAAAIRAGGKGIMPPTDMFYGDRSGGVTDPAGNHWFIATHIEDVGDAEFRNARRRNSSRSRATTREAR